MNNRYNPGSMSYAPVERADEEFFLPYSFFQSIIRFVCRRYYYYSLKYIKLIFKATINDKFNHLSKKYGQDPVIPDQL